MLAEVNSLVHNHHMRFFAPNKCYPHIQKRFKPSVRSDTSSIFSWRWRSDIAHACKEFGAVKPMQERH